MAKTTEMVEVALSKLKPYERNAKKHPKEQVEKIKNSIIEFGFLSPCLIDKDNNIIAGHGRVMAAQELGIESVPCVYVEGLTEEQRRAYILADNRLTELGGWDDELLNIELEELSDAGFDVAISGFEWNEIGNIDIVDDEYIADESTFDKIEARVKPGDLWRLGRHRLKCGDSTSTQDVQELMGGRRRIYASRLRRITSGTVTSSAHTRPKVNPNI